MRNGIGRSILVVIFAFVIAFFFLLVSISNRETNRPEDPMFCTTRVLEEEGVDYGLTTLSNTEIPAEVALRVRQECFQ